MKRCIECKVDRPLDYFRKTFIKSVGKYYYRSHCKRCQNKLRSVGRNASPTAKKKLNEHRLDYYHRNKQRMNKLRTKRRTHEK